MVGFVLTGHGEFAPGLASALDLFAGPQENFDVVPFDVRRAGEYPHLISAAIATMREHTDGVLVMCDLIGGTPYYQSMTASAMMPDVRVVAGANLPMVIETGFTRNADTSATTDSLATVALDAGKSGVESRLIS